MSDETKPGADIVADARKRLANRAGRESTHSKYCHQWHDACLIARLVAECDRLREAIRRLADQDGTLSVQGGNVTVDMDATLTAEERAAVAYYIGTGGPDGVDSTLRALLDRLG